MILSRCSAFNHTSNDQTILLYHTMLQTTLLRALAVTVGQSVHHCWCLASLPSSGVKRRKSSEASNNKRRIKIDGFVQSIDDVLFCFGSILVAFCSLICGSGGSYNKVSSLQHLRALAVTEPFHSRPQRFKTYSSRTLQLLNSVPWLIWQTHSSFQDMNYHQAM